MGWQCRLRVDVRLDGRRRRRCRRWGRWRRGWTRLFALLVLQRLELWREFFAFAVGPYRLWVVALALERHLLMSGLRRRRGKLCGRGDGRGCKEGMGVRERTAR